MARTKPAAPAAKAEGYPVPALRMLNDKDAAKARDPHAHIYRKNVLCETDKRGQKMPDGRSELELVVNATEGFIPLWDQGVILRWRFNEASMSAFADPPAAKRYIADLFASAVNLWGLDNVPVRFMQVRDAWDFEFKVSRQENCSDGSCTLARAFFPDAGQHDILIYPTMFNLDAKEQVETLAHEIGHVFGLRHFFAQVLETGSPSEIFGKHSKFSIMNYGNDSAMSKSDRSDLKALYRAAWSGKLTKINGTDIRLVRPFSTLRVPVPQALAFRDPQVA